MKRGLIFENKIGKEVKTMVVENKKNGVRELTETNDKPNNNEEANKKKVNKDAKDALELLGDLCAL
jgi:hypothetical protein